MLDASCTLSLQLESELQSLFLDSKGGDRLMRRFLRTVACAARTRQPPDFVRFAEGLPRFGFLKRAQSSEPRVPAPRLFGAVELGEPPDFVTVAELFERAPEHEKAIKDSFSCGVCQAWQKLLRSREGVSLYTRDELPTDDCALFRCSC